MAAEMAPQRFSITFCTHLVLLFPDGSNDARATWERSSATTFIYITQQPKLLKTTLIILSLLGYLGNSIGLSLVQ